MLLLSGLASAQDLLIRNATVHTASAQGTLRASDVLVRNGRIAAIGSGLAAGNATVVDGPGGRGRHLDGGSLGCVGARRWWLPGA